MRIWLLAYAIIQFVGLSSWASQNILYDKIQKRILSVQSVLASQNAMHLHEGFTSECLQRYDRFYNDSELNVAIGIGYNDARPYDTVEDLTIEAAVANLLTAPCSKNQSVCGFKQMKTPPGDFVAKYFGKSVYGPDHKPRIIRVKVFHASLTADDDVNRANPKQILLSNRAEADFRLAFKTADVVLYLGHSRDGGGPDFDPPKLLPNNHVDYSWYHKNKSDFQELLSEMDKSNSPPKLVGLLSCYSNLHFASPLRRISPETGLLVSLKEITDGQIFEGLITVLNGIQRFKCEKQLASDLEASNIDKTKVGNVQKSLLEFRNFPPR